MEYTRMNAILRLNKNNKLDFNDDYAKIFKALRLKNKLTLIGLSKYMPFKPSYISRLENRNSKITMKAMLNYSQLFNISINLMINILALDIYNILSYLEANKKNGIGVLNYKVENLCLAHSIVYNFTTGSYTDLQNDYSEVLKLLRITNNINVADLSNYIQIPIQTIYNYEYKVQKASIIDINKYTEFFNMDPDVIHIYADRQYKGLNNFIDDIIRIDLEIKKQYKR